MAHRYVLLATLVIVTPFAVAQQPGMDGAEFQVAGADDLYESRLAVATSETGAFVVAWEVRTDLEIWARRFDDSGASAGNAFVVGSSYGPYRPSQPGVASSYQGDFVVVWTGFGEDYYGVRARRHDAAGTPQGSEFQVNTTTDNYQYYPAVAMNPTGDFVVVWGDTSGPQADVTAQLFDAAGVHQGDELPVTGEPDRPSGADVAMDALGNFVAVWRDNDEDGLGVFGRLYDGNGIPMGDAFQINTRSIGHQYEPAVAMDAQGNFVVAWEDGDAVAIRARRFDENGDALDETEFRVDSGTAFWHESPDVATNGTHGFVVTWTGWLGYGDRREAFGRRYDLGGQPVGAEFRVNTHRSGDQWTPAVAMAPSGDFVVVWEGPEPEGVEDGIFGQRFCATPAVSAPAAQELCEAESASFTVNAAGRLPFAFQWRRDGVAIENGESVQGATGPTLTIDPAGTSDSGSYDCVIVDSCSNAQTVVSPNASLAVHSMPGAASEVTLAKDVDGLVLHITWTDTADSDDYVVREDTDPQGGFETITGTSSGGGVGLPIPMPEGVAYFLVAGHNADCGEGPLRR